MNRIIVACLFSVQLSFSVFGADALRDYLQSQTRYWGIHEKISTADFNQLVELKRKADEPGLSQEQRTKAYTDLFHFVQKVRGLPEGRVPGALAASYWTAGEFPMHPVLHRAKPGQVGNYVKRGSGKIPMILIPDIGIDSSVFDSFMQGNLTDFTFYAVTLPGFGGTDPPPLQERLDFGTMKWWNNATAGVLDLIAKEKLDRPFLLGHQAGSYLAMRLALERPADIRGVIVLNGLLFAPVPGIPQNATVAERVRVVNGFAPVELFPHPSPSKYAELMLQGREWLCKNKERQEYIARLIARGEPSVWWNYFAELATTDLTHEIKNLKSPMLVLPSVYDRESPGFETSKIALDQWNPLDQSKRSLPIKVVPLQDCRAYATEDQPAKLDEEIRNWTAQH